MPVPGGLIRHPAQRGQRSESPAAPELPRSAGPGGRGVTKWTQGAPSLTTRPSAPLPGAASSQRPASSSSSGGEGAARSMGWAAGGGQRSGQRLGARGASPRLALGSRIAQDPRSGRASTANAGPSGAVQLSRPGGGRGEGAAEAGPRAPDPPAPPGRPLGPLGPPSWGNMPQGAHRPTAGDRSEDPKLPWWGQRGGRIRERGTLSPHSPTPCSLLQGNLIPSLPASPGGRLGLKG